MQNLKPIIVIFLFFIACDVTYAQNSISVSNQIPQYMSLDPNYYEGNPPKLTFQYSEWINYTTLIDYYGEPAFSISVQLVSKHKPKELELRAVANPYKGLSREGVGKTTGIKTVSRSARVLIDNITTCYSGSGRGQGHRTMLFFSVPNYIKADTGTYKINVVFTLRQ